MSTEMDMKALWNKQSTSEMPDMKELLERADKLKRTTRNKLIGLNVLLLSTVVFIACIVFNIDHVKPVTIVGTALIAVAIISYLIVSNQIIPMLFKTNPEASSHEYLEQLIRIKRKQDFLNKVMINIYFSLLSAGLFLYMLQFSKRMTLAWGLIYYTITFGWIAFAWFYLRPRGMRKKLKPLNDMIAKLEAVNGQLSSSQ